MKRLLIWLLGVSCTAGTLRAQNFIQNGDFENGTSAWAFAGAAVISNNVPVSSGIYAVLLSGTSGNSTGSVSQSFATQPGEAYRLTFDYGETGGVQADDFVDYEPNVGVLLAVRNSSGYNVVYSAFYHYISDTSNYARHTALFVATSATTSITFTNVSGLTAAAGLLDNVNVSAVQPYQHPGTYRGSVRVTREIPQTDAKTTLSYSVVAHINSQGQIAGFFAPVAETFTGTIDNFGDVTYDESEDMSGSATFSKNELRITVPEQTGFGGNFRNIGIDVTRQFVLKRVGP